MRGQIDLGARPLLSDVSGLLPRAATVGAMATAITFGSLFPGAGGSVPGHPGACRFSAVIRETRFRRICDVNTARNVIRQLSSALLELSAPDSVRVGRTGDTTNCVTVGSSGNRIAIDVMFVDGTTISPKTMIRGRSTCIRAASGV